MSRPAVEAEESTQDIGFQMTKDLKLLETAKSAIDERYLVEQALRLLSIPTEVPLGPDTFLPPDAPKLVHYVQSAFRSELSKLGVYNVRDVPENQLLIEMGQGQGTAPSLMVATYTVTQHHNLMVDPFRARVSVPQGSEDLGPCLYGQGASQNKVHQAVVLSVLEAIMRLKISLQGSLWLAINNEGRSSHACTEAMLAAMPTPPEQAVILNGTGLDISVGNRGRLDIRVHLEGKACHSSDPEAGASAIDGVNEVLNRLKAVNWGEDVHELLGGRHLVPYQVSYHPIAPHTLPASAEIVLDRRMLPGDSADAAVREVREAIGTMRGYSISVEKSVEMAPALVDPDETIVNLLRDGTEAMSGIRPKKYYSKGAFDAGGFCSAGIPAVMWGARGSWDILGDDFVPIRDAVSEARALLYAVMSAVGTADSDQVSI